MNSPKGKPRDLRFPDDARRAYDGLVAGLEYDAGFAVLGERLHGALPDIHLPRSTTVVRFGRGREEQAVRRDLAGLCTRFSTISMITRFERFGWSLLFQRRFLEHWTKSLGSIPGSDVLQIRRKVDRQMRNQSLAKIVLGALVEQPSPGLKARSTWLDGVYRVRNCLSHRQGTVQIEDVNQGDDTLLVVWRSIKVIVDGRELEALPYTIEAGGQGRARFEDTERAWKIGEVIHLKVQDCQDIAFSFAELGHGVLSEFEREINRSLRGPQPS